MAAATKRLSSRAPTWSWVSVDGAVDLGYSLPGMFDDKYAHVLDADITLHGQDPFGQVRGGVLRVACSLMGAGRLLESHDLHDSALNVCSLDLEGGPSDVDGRKPLFQVDKDCINEHADSDERMYLLPFVGGHTGTIVDPRPHVAFRELVLRPSGIQKGDYRRFGYFNFTGTEPELDASGSSGDTPLESGVKGAYYVFQEILRQTGEATAEDACAEVIVNAGSPGEQHVIYI